MYLNKSIVYWGKRQNIPNIKPSKIHICLVSLGWGRQIAVNTILTNLWQKASLCNKLISEITEANPNSKNWLQPFQQRPRKLLRKTGLLPAQLPAPAVTKSSCPTKCHGRIAATPASGLQALWISSEIINFILLFYF